jgi:hypothetical protein
VPYTAPSNIYNAPVIEGGSGYWSKLVDVYAPEFPGRVDSIIKDITGKHSQNPLCIGYFVDNELGWKDIRQGTLNSPSTQACRKVLIAQLQQKYATIQALNEAWGTKATSWDAVKTPATFNEACTEDLDIYAYQFAKRYFKTIQNTIRKYAPNQLYLGCRFGGWEDDTMVEKACADIIDVLSYNNYSRGVSDKRWDKLLAFDKPTLIGEFHFGALDRGMLHPGLVASSNQQERAKAFGDYVLSVVDHPAFVGCHWFQYADEPLTGRSYDGENYNIGFVDGTDTPYPEMVDSAKKAHKGLYQRRFDGTRSIP